MSLNECSNNTSPTRIELHVTAWQYCTFVSFPFLYVHFVLVVAFAHRLALPHSAWHTRLTLFISCLSLEGTSPWNLRVNASFTKLKLCGQENAGR
jgi:hypothetical protein